MRHGDAVQKPRRRHAKSLAELDDSFQARIAREADCSVGALYARFPEKNAYLYHVVASAYRTMASHAETELEIPPTRHLSLPSLVRLVVEHAINTMTSPRAAGVIRSRRQR